MKDRNSPDAFVKANIMSKMTLIEEANKLADDIAEYAPSTNIELMIRDLIKEIERLQSEKIARS